MTTYQGLAKSIGKTVAVSVPLASIATIGASYAQSQDGELNTAVSSIGGLKGRIANHVVRYGLSVEEAQRLHAVLAEWPDDLQATGVEEELRDVLAARELSQMRPLTVADVLAIKRTIA
jgi:hypothetical protein